MAKTTTTTLEYCSLASLPTHLEPCSFLPSTTSVDPSFFHILVLFCRWCLWVESSSKIYHHSPRQVLAGECGKDACSGGQRYVRLTGLPEGFRVSWQCSHISLWCFHDGVLSNHFPFELCCSVHLSRVPKLTPHFRHHHLHIYHNRTRRSCSRKPTSPAMDCSATSSPR